MHNTSIVTGASKARIPELIAPAGPQGTLQEALDAYQQELTIDKKLASQDPTNPKWQNGAAWSRYCVAKILIRIRR